jgi:chromosome segregation ATPase
LELRVSSFTKPRGKLEEQIESQARELESLRGEIERQRESINRPLAVVNSRFDELLREFEKLRGEVQAVKDSAGGEIEKLTSETAKVAKSVSGLETLRREFDDVKVSVQRLQQDFTRVPQKSQSKVEIPMKSAESVDGIKS